MEDVYRFYTAPIIMLTAMGIVIFFLFKYERKRLKTIKKQRKFLENFSKTIRTLDENQAKDILGRRSNTIMSFYIDSFQEKFFKLGKFLENIRQEKKLGEEFEYTPEEKKRFQELFWNIAKKI